MNIDASVAVVRFKRNAHLNIDDGVQNFAPKKRCHNDTLNILK